MPAAAVSFVSSSRQRRYKAPSPASALFTKVQRFGRLGVAYSRFLCWRADLLSADEMSAFREAHLDSPPLSGLELAGLLREELGARGDALLRRMEPQAAWSSPWRCGFRAQYLDRSVAVQVARAPFSDAEVSKFTGSLRKDRELDHSLINSPEMLRQFREWLCLPDDPQRERSYLETVREFAPQTSFVYPEIIPEICSRRVLCWTWLEGEPLSPVLESADRPAVIQLTELVLEQCCNFGMVDGDLDPRSILIAADGRLVVQHWSRMISLPPALMPSALKYLSGVMSGNYPTAGRMLLRLALGRSPENLQAELLRELASTAPDLKGSLQFPPSAMIFESNCRALSKVVAHRPLYLDCLHRNLDALACWCAETAGPDASADPIVEAQFTVLGRMLRTRTEGLMRVGVASEWALESTILFVETVRQIGHTAEDLRENDLSIGIDIEGTPAGQESRNCFTRSVVSVGVLLIVLFICLRWGPSLPARWSLLPEIIALLASLRMLWVVMRTG